ncbi:hypothetical protein CEP52_005692 [Fusarium oligoseptatum]|uniref:Formate/nitrite transporter n=1 Tax=Fusarium oligoseptatum TaxID=2604345 RepID=A0A428TX06_9HYPO|nr:hypothetical protein CEP52_005692 [Fusarium oligoseptatum]
MANSTVDAPNFAAYTPAETAELICRAGVKKGNTRPDKENAPGLVKLAGAIVFPIGLVAIFLTGAELFTSTNMFTMVAVLNRRLSVWKMLLHWFLCFFGNLLGSLFVMALIVGYGGIFDADPYKKEIQTYTTKKQLAPEAYQIFIRMIPALFGNILGGSLCCGVYFWWIFLASEGPVDNDGSGMGVLDGRGKATASDEESRIE